MKWALSSPSPDRSGNRGTDRVSQLLESTQLASGRAQSGVAVWPQSPCSKPLGLVSKNLQKVQALIPNFHAPTSVPPRPSSLHTPSHHWRSALLPGSAGTLSHSPSFYSRLFPAKTSLPKIQTPTAHRMSQRSTKACNYVFTGNASFPVPSDYAVCQGPREPSSSRVAEN